jgi:hypothetical protein
VRLHLGCLRGLSETSFHHRRESFRRDGESLIMSSDGKLIFSRFDGGVSGDAVEAAQVGGRLSCGPATTMWNCSGLDILQDRRSSAERLSRTCCRTPSCLWQSPCAT